jgi:hypothetical protein
VLAAKGMVVFSKSYRIELKRTLIILFVLSLPWLLVFNLNFQLHARDAKQPDFFHQDEVAALGFLKQQPPGIVLSSGRSGSYVPYYADKISVMGGTIAGEEQRKSDYRIFVSGNDEERRKILDKYRISYVFYGYSEVTDGMKLENETYLEQIYNKGSVRIFRVR